MQLCSCSNAMKNQYLKEKFKNNSSVRPLYKKVHRNVTPNNLLVSINVDKTYKLEGNDFNVRRQIVSDVNGEVLTVNTRTEDILPGVCEKVHKKVKAKSVANTTTVLIISDPKLQDIKMLDSASEIVSDNIVRNSTTNKLVQAERLVVIKNVPDSWLRVFPLPALPKETICSIIFRCIICQIGLATVLILWTVIWTFVIHSFEGPYELEISEDFKNEQNQLVIDLATELRQITPLSPKWRDAIERRIEDERRLTVLAVGRGARAHPGQFWDLPGTFLFTIYVMTALGFGAPVPHTILGRTSAIIYAFIAVPAHIYLMVNASTCLIVNLETCCCRRRKVKKRIDVGQQKSTSGSNAENQNCSTNGKMVENSKNGKLRKKILRVLCIPCVCHCVPLAAVIYYACGAIAFGVLRVLPAIDTCMFPLEFTTTGGLEHVEGYVRVLYGIYVEGAMVLLSSALARLKRHSSATVNTVAVNYRLFQVEGP